MSGSFKIFIVLVLLAGAIYSFSPMLRSLSDGPDLTPEEFEMVIATKPSTAQILVKKLDDHRVPNQLEAYGHGRNIVAIRKGIDDDTEAWFDLLTEAEIVNINWYEEEIPTRISRIMSFELVSFENKRDGEAQRYFVYLDDDYRILGWRKG